MNRKRREMVLSAISTLESAKDVLDDVLYEETDAMENIPENLQSSERYEKMEENVDILQDAIDDINEAIEKLSDID